MFPMTSDPVDALVTTQPTKTFLPNLAGKELGSYYSIVHPTYLCVSMLYLL